MKKTVLVARGINDLVDAGMLSNVTRHLDPAEYEIVELRHPAEYGPASGFWGASFNESMQVLKWLATEYLDAERPGRVFLLGYSAGAFGLGDLVAELLGANSPLIDRILGVGLLADPKQPLAAAPAGLAKYGIAGSRPIVTDRFPVWWVSDPRDPIPLTELNSPLRPIPDLTAQMSFRDVNAWRRDVRRRLLARQVQQFAVNLHDIPGVLADFRAAVDALGRYLGPDHTSYAVRRYPGADVTYCEWLAQQIVLEGARR
ncbi:hypothetical protein GS462_11115 [Rhodococcus hoagii]|nr:hypothetical protein [Prescottella equi]MBM4650962.1 hypothetical protein [Prescottella equi]MBM4686691.1 hypothetical protein [Prescottella equi]